MHRIKNLTNSPHKIILAGNKMGRLAARGEDVFDVAPQLLPHYKTLGYLQLTEVKEQEPPPVVVEKPELVSRAKALGIAGVGLNWGVPKLQAAIAEAEKAKADSGQAGGEG